MRNIIKIERCTERGRVGVGRKWKAGEEWERLRMRDRGGETHLSIKERGRRGGV